MTMVCEKCGAVIERKNASQKYCLECSFKRERDYFFANREKCRESQKRSHEKAKAREKAKKPKVNPAGTGCTKWRTCEYGMHGQDVCGNVLCRYFEKTGKCKIIEVDGRKTVAPTKNCVFYKRKKKGDAL